VNVGRRLDARGLDDERRLGQHQVEPLTGHGPQQVALPDVDVQAVEGGVEPGEAAGPGGEVGGDDAGTQPGDEEGEHPRPGPHVEPAPERRPGEGAGQVGGRRPGRHDGVTGAPRAVAGEEQAGQRAEQERAPEVARAGRLQQVAGRQAVDGGGADRRLQQGRRGAVAVGEDPGEEGLGVGTVAQGGQDQRDPGGVDLAGGERHPGTDPLLVEPGHREPVTEPHQLLGRQRAAVRRRRQHVLGHGATLPTGLVGPSTGADRSDLGTSS
jgi:hypothetical protein